MLAIPTLSLSRLASHILRLNKMIFRGPSTGQKYPDDMDLYSE